MSSADRVPRPPEVPSLRNGGAGIDSSGSLLGAALGYAARGWRIHPVQGKDRPLTKWKEEATDNPETIRGWYTRWPDASIALACGPASGVFAVDLDRKKNDKGEIVADGFASLAAWERENAPLPYTMESRTGGNGAHLIFRWPSDGSAIPNGINVLGPGVDVRGDGGYIILPPSIHSSGKLYAWSEDSPTEPEEPPAALVRALQSRVTAYTGGAGATTAGAPRVGELATVIHEHEGRDNAMTSLAGSLRNRGLNAVEILEALRPVNQSRCKPPLSERDLTRIANSIGSRPDNGTTPVVTAAGEPLPRWWDPVDLHKADIPVPEAFLPGGVLSRGSVTLVAGRRGSGKTYLTLVLARALALGEPFGPLATRKARVAYLSQEMSEGAIKRRISRLWTDPELAALSDGLRISCKGRLLASTDADIERVVRHLSSVNPDVVIIDALRDIKLGVEENANDAMGDLMVRLRDGLAEKLNAAVLVIHHMGKPGNEGVEKGGRGASVIEDVVSDILYLRHPKGSTYREGAWEKTRDGDMEGSKFWYQIVGGERGADSVTVAVGAGPAPHDAPISSVRSALAVVQRLVVENAPIRFTPLRKLIQAALGIAVRTAENYIRTAVQEGLIVKESDRYRPQAMIPLASALDGASVPRQQPQYRTPLNGGAVHAVGLQATAEPQETAFAATAVNSLQTPAPNIEPCTSFRGADPEGPCEACDSPYFSHASPWTATTTATDWQSDLYTTVAEPPDEVGLNPNGAKAAEGEA